MRILLKVVLTLAVTVGVLAVGERAAAAELGVERASIGAGGLQTTAESGGGDASGDGRYVVFHSQDRNLVPDDTNGVTDVFLRDLLAGTTSRISTADNGAQGNGESLNASISADGRFVAFQSAAANLVPNDLNGHVDVFVKDRVTGTVTRVSVTSGGQQADGGSDEASISDDGMVVAFGSYATNLVAGDSNGQRDVFVRNRRSSTTVRVNVTTSGADPGVGAYHGDLSGDGRYVAFYSTARNLASGMNTDGQNHVFVRDLSGGSTVVASVGANGNLLGGVDHGDPAISTDGRFVAFRSSAGPTFTIRRWARSANASELVSVDPDGRQVEGSSFGPAISGDGRMVAFTSRAPDLVGSDVNGQNDVFVRDASIGLTRRVSVDAAGVGGTRPSQEAALSADGSTAVFRSLAPELVEDDTNGVWDVFAVRGLDEGADDTDAPELVELSASPSTIDRAQPERAISVALRLLDRSGAEAPRVRLVHDGTGAATPVATAVRESGDAFDGRWRAGLTLPEAADLGPWSVTIEPLVDSLGNVGPPGPPEVLGAAVEVVDLTIAGGAPVVTAFNFTPRVLGPSGGDVTVTVSARDPSGVSAPVVSFDHATSSAATPTSTARLVEGTADLGTWQAVVTFPAGAAPGTWRAVLAPVTDAAGNATPIGPASGFPDSLLVDPNLPESGTGGGGGGSGGGPGGGGGGGAGGGGGSGPGGPSGYWMLGDVGVVHAFGAAGYFGAPRTDLAVEGIGAVDMAATPSGAGYWVLDERGDVHAYGDARDLGDVPDALLAVGERTTTVAATPTGRGYWVFTDRGRAVDFGDAAFFGDLLAVPLNGAVVDSVSTPTGRGYYMVGADGGIFAFGDAVFHGSMGGIPLNGPVVGLAPTPSNEGYWLVADDGGIFSFGDAVFRGSMGATVLNRPVNGMVAFGDGYLMVASDGGIFNFSSLPFHGSLGGAPPPWAIVGVAPLSR